MKTDWTRLAKYIWNVHWGLFAHPLSNSESPMETTPKIPVFQFGLYRLEDATVQHGSPTKFKCNECKKDDVKAKPFLEVSQLHMCVTIVCPHCGANNPLVYGPVQRVTWQPVPDPEHT